MTYIRALISFGSCCLDSHLSPAIYHSRLTTALLSYCCYPDRHQVNDKATSFSPSTTIDNVCRYVMVLLCLVMHWVVVGARYPHYHHLT